jgi:hypothetical protein
VISIGKRCVPALVLAAVALCACDNGTRMAKSQFAPTVPVTPTVTSTASATTAPATTEPATVSPEPPTTPTATGPPTTPHAPPPTKPPSQGTGSAGSPLAVGTGHLIGKTYRVVVTSVNLNADRAIEAANSFNSPPKGRYVLVGLAVQYLGNDTGSPWIDLREHFVGADAREYDSSQCAAVVARPGIFQPDLEHGGRSHFQICFDVPPDAIAGAKIFLNETFEFDGPKVYWKTR